MILLGLPSQKQSGAVFLLMRVEGGGAGEVESLSFKYEIHGKISSNSEKMEEQDRFNVIFKSPTSQPGDISNYVD